MNGYVAQRRGRFYAVIYQGRDPITGKELRRWHPAGTDRATAEALAHIFATKEQQQVEAPRSLTFGAYLTTQWLPTKKLHLATSTYRGYERNVTLHVLPAGQAGLFHIRAPPPGTRHSGRVASGSGATTGEQRARSRSSSATPTSARGL